MGFYHTRVTASSMSNARLIRSVILAAGGFVGGLVAAAALVALQGPGRFAVPSWVGGVENRIAARVGEGEIGLAEVDSRIRGDLAMLDLQRYEARENGLERILEEILFSQEAEQRGIDVVTLENIEVVDKASTVREGEIDAFHREHHREFNFGSLDDALRDQIHDHLFQQELNARRRAFVGVLREAAGVEILLRPPLMPISTEGAPAKGPATAPVTLVEFADFQCPFCGQVQQTLERIMADYPDEVRVVFRHFPLDDLHPQSRAAAEAAACAAAHGEFWAYHDLLFAHQDALGPDELVVYARQAGIDVEAFRTCVNEHRFAEQVERDLTDGMAAGVSGTPAFLINGRPLTGPPEYEELRERIEAELKRKG